MVVGNTKLSSSSDPELWLLGIAGSSREVPTVLLMLCQVPASLQKGQFAMSMQHVLQFAAWCVKPHRFQFALMSWAVNCDILEVDVLLGWGHCALPAPCPWLSKLRSWEEKEPISLFVPLRNGGCWSRSCSELLMSHSVYYHDQIMAVLEESSYLHCLEHLGPSQPAASLVSLSREFNISQCCSKDEWLWWDHILCLTEHASGERGIRGTCGAAAAQRSGVSCIAKPFSWGKIEGTREIRGLYILILVQMVLSALAFNNLKENPLGIFSLFPTLMGHIFLDHPLMFCFIGWGFFKEGIKSDLS